MDVTMAHQVANHALSFQPSIGVCHADWTQPKGEFDSTKLSGYQVGGNWICPACSNCNYGFRMRCNMKKCGCVRPPDYGRARSESSDEAQDPSKIRPSPIENGDDAAESFKDTHSQSCCSEESRNETNSVVTSTLSQCPDEETPPLLQDANLSNLGNLTTVDVSHLRFLQSYLGTLIQKAEQKEQKGDIIKGKCLHSADDNRQNLSSDSIGDWLCPSCGNINYGFRSACNMRKCGAPRPQNKQLCQIPHDSNQNGAGGKYISKLSNSQSDVKSQPGSWECTACGNWNYLFRDYCNMKRCRAKRPIQHNMQDSTQNKGGSSFVNPPQQTGRVFKQTTLNTSPQKSNMYTHSKEQGDYVRGQSNLFGGFELSNNINTAALESMKNVIADIWKCAPDAENTQPHHSIGTSVAHDTSEHSNLNCFQLRNDFLAYGHC